MDMQEMTDLLLMASAGLAAAREQGHFEEMTSGPQAGRRWPESPSALQGGGNLGGQAGLVMTQLRAEQGVAAETELEMASESQFVAETGSEELEY